MATVGIQITPNDINSKVNGLVTACWDSLDQVRRFHLWLTDATHTDAFLNNIGITGSASSGDVQSLRNSIADLGGASGLWAVAHGSFAPTGASNYFFNAKALTGTNFTG